MRSGATVLKALLQLVACAWLSMAYGQDRSAQIQAEIKVRPEFARYTNLLMAPSYLLVAADNIHASPLAGGRISIKDAASFRYRYVQVRFTGTDGAVYRYEADIEWNFALGTATLTALIDLDTSHLSDGRARLRVHFPLAALLPSELIDRIQNKLARLADLNQQDRILAYLARQQARIDSAPAPKPTLFELLLLDEYNQSVTLGSNVREPGDAETLSDQALFLLTVLIWLIAVPAAVVLRRRSLRNIAKTRP